MYLQWQELTMRDIYQAGNPLAVSQEERDRGVVTCSSGSNVNLPLLLRIACEHSLG